MKLTIRSVFVGECPNIRNWQPEDPQRVAVMVCVDIGPKTRKGADTFCIRVATPDGLHAMEAKDGILATRPLLIMHRYDFNDLWRWLERTVAACEAETWPACVEKLQRYFDWEYDGYKES